MMRPNPARLLAEAGVLAEVEHLKSSIFRGFYRALSCH